LFWHSNNVQRTLQARFANKSGSLPYGFLVVRVLRYHVPFPKRSYNVMSFNIWMFYFYNDTEYWVTCIYGYMYLSDLEENVCTYLFSFNIAKTFRERCKNICPVYPCRCHLVWWRLEYYVTMWRFQTFIQRYGRQQRIFIFFATIQKIGPPVTCIYWYVYAFDLKYFISVHVIYLTIALSYLTRIYE
jgi:hypothetical protein